MANIKLAVIGDFQQVYKEVEALEKRINGIKPLEIKVSATQATEAAKKATEQLNKEEQKRTTTAQKEAEKRQTISHKEAEKRTTEFLRSAGKITENEQKENQKRLTNQEKANQKSQENEQRHNARMVEQAQRQADRLAASQQRADQQAEAQAQRHADRMIEQQQRQEQRLELYTIRQQQMLERQSRAHQDFSKVVERATSVYGQFAITLGRRLSNAAINAVTSSFREALSTMREVDQELANIRKVTDAPESVINELGAQSYDVASRYGISAQDYLSAAAEFAKAGYSNYGDMAELATKTQLVGDVAAETATKFLISTDAAFKMGGSIEELTTVLDKANIIENNFATSIEKLAGGFPIVANVAAMTNMSVDETVAALGTITAVTQESGQMAARALRALVLNIMKDTQTEIEEGVNWTEQEIETLQDVLMKYSGEAMRAAQEAGKIVNPIEAFRGLSEAYKSGDLTQAELAQLASGLGGKLRTNQLLALVQNMDMFDEMLGMVEDSAGSADKEISVLLETWNAKTNQLKNSWTKFVSELIDSGEIKGLIDEVRSFVEGLDAEQIGGDIRNAIEPIIRFIQDTDWKAAGQNISNIFDKITKFAQAAVVVSTLSTIYGWLSSIFSMLGSIGGLLGIGGAVGVAAGGGIVAAIGVLAAGVLAVADNFAKTNRVFSEATRELDQQRESVERANEAYRDSTDEISATALVADAYIRKLQEMEQNGLDADDAASDYHDTLVRLTQLIPELSEVIDLDNNSIKGGTEALYDNIEAWKANSTERAIAARKAAIVDAIAEAQVQNQINTIRRDKAQSGILADWDALQAEADNITNNIIVPGADVDDATLQRLTEITEWQDANYDAYLEATRQVEAYNAAIEEGSNLIDELEGQLRELEELESKETSSQQPKAEDFLSPGATDDMSRVLAMQEYLKASQETAQVTQDGFEESAEAAEENEERTGAAVSATTRHLRRAAQHRRELRTELQSVNDEIVGDTEDFAEETGETLADGLRDSEGEIQAAAAEMTRSIGDGIISQSGYIKSKISEVVGIAKQFIGGLSASGSMSYHPEGQSWWVDSSGSVHTAHAEGTSNAPGGPTLVNELGPELISENGRAYIAGGGRPTVVNLSPGAIVIPADQTEEALKGGMPRYARASMNATSLWGSGKATTTWTGRGGRGGGGSSGGGSSGGSASNSPDFSSLEKKLSDLLRNLELQIKLAENEGDYVQVVKLYEKAQEAVKGLVDKYRAAGYGEDSTEVLTLLNKNYDYAGKQLDIYRTKWDELIKALQADTDATKAASALEEKRQAAEDARESLANAQSQRTVRIYNAATGQWEWVADEGKVKSAQSALTKAEESYNEQVKSSALTELKALRDNPSDLSGITFGPALSAVATMSESSPEFQNFARALDAVFGVGSFLQSTEGSTSVLPTVDSHDTNYSFGGVSLSQEQAGSMSLMELAKLLSVLKIT